MQPARADADYDLCFFMCQFPNELPEVEQVAGWRQRSRLACAFVLETWPHLFGKQRVDLRILDKFDHVFVLNAESIPALRAHTSTPISFLPVAADCLLVPEREPPAGTLHRLLEHRPPRGGDARGPQRLRRAPRPVLRP